MRLGHGLALSTTLAIALTMTGTPGRAAMGGTTDLAYTPLDPCVVASTGRQRLSPGAAWPIIVREGVDLSPQGGSPLGCGVPGDAMAVQIHVQAQRPRGFGRVYVWPPDRSRPDVALLSHVPRLSSQATTIVSLCSSNGACAADLAIEASGRSTRLTIRVLGYFRSPVSPLAGQACPADECVTGFDEDGGLVCAPCDAAQSCPADCSGHGVCESGECTCEVGWTGSDCGTQTQAPLDCQVGEFGAWSECSETCGSGTRTRTRPIIQEPANGGQACPTLTQTESCSTQPCPTDCVLGNWTAWGACSATCGGGVQTRSRSVLQPPANGGQACGAVTETRACNTQACPVQCQVSSWSAWGPCSATCGGGVQTRMRSILQPGADCPPLTETQSCNSVPCPVDCELSEFGAWSACSASCGGGVRTRSRSILQPPAYGGSACSPLTQNEACNTQPCPVDCQVSAWGAWGPCSVSCGEGVQTRTRSILQPPSGGGLSCPVLQDTQTCNAGPCP